MPWCEQKLIHEGCGQRSLEKVIVDDHFDETYFVVEESHEKSKGGRVEMRVGKILKATEKDVATDVFDDSISNMNDIGIHILMFILSFISCRKTCIELIKIRFSDDIVIKKCAETEFIGNFTTAIITFNPNIVKKGPFFLIVTLLHELSHILSSWDVGHRVDNFCNHNICLFGVMYYRLPQICKKLNFNFDFDKLNNIFQVENFCGFSFFIWSLLWNNC